MDFVVGSGPAGVMCALALLRRGRSVTMLDVGREIEKSPLEPGADGAASGAGAAGAVNSHGFPKKLVFGSAFAYAEDQLAGIVQRGVECTMSFAKGGLSNVWGAAVLPNVAEEFEKWPFGIERMAPHYKYVAEEIGIAGAHDEIERAFPFYAPPIPAAKLSRQAEYVLARMRARGAALRKNGIEFGRSRLAMLTRPDKFGRVCKNIGQCLTGCPYGAVYNSEQTLERMQENPLFKYVPSARVEFVREDASGEGDTRNGVEICCSDGRAFNGERIFLGCGPLSTIKIIFRSLVENGLLPSVGGVRGGTGTEEARLEKEAHFELGFQPYFFLPLLGFKNFRGVNEERLHTLAQLFIEITDKKICPGIVHTQLYTYNSMIQDKLRKIFGPFAGIAGRVILGRLMFLQGYLNGDNAGTIAVRASFAKGGASGGVELFLEGAHVKSTKKIIKKICRKFLVNSRALGAAPILSMLKIGVPGYGNHIGSVFPMKKNPVGFETDAFGRLPGLKNTHIVDGSALTTISSSTITYTIMANAHRIGWEAADL